MAPRVDKNYQEEIKKARAELEIVISKEKSSARNLLRSAYASQFSIAHHYRDAVASTAKNHLKTIEKIHIDHPTITYPDLYQLAGVVAVKALKGPEIEFVPGRTDSPISPDESCLPDLKRSPSEIREFFRKVKISEPRHIVALYGGLKLATAGDQGGHLTFDNSYFVDLVNQKDLSPSDKAFLGDTEFSNLVKCYANNKDDFFKDYIDAHMKLSELGLPYSAFFEAAFKRGASQVQNVIATTPRSVGVGVGFAVAAAVVIISVFYLINKRRTQHPSQQFQ